jgi:peptidyl-prolyl cis-trans isomerase C
MLLLALACWSQVPDAPPPRTLLVVAPTDVERVSMACGEGVRTLDVVDGRAVFEGLDGSCTLRVERFPITVAESAIVVNGFAVSEDALIQAAGRLAPGSPEGLTADQRAQLVNDAIDNELLRQEAWRQGLHQDPKVAKVMVNTLLRDQVYSNVRNSDFSDDELRAYYDAHRDEFSVPEKVQIKRIVIRYGDDRSEAEAKELAESLAARALPSTIKDLAMEYSEGPYRRRGGDLGFVSAEGKPGLDPGFVAEAMVAPMDSAQVYDRGDAWIVYVVVNRRERVERTFQQMKGSVLRKVKNDRLKEMYRDYVDTLKVDAIIQVDQAAVDALPLEPATRPALTDPQD